MRHFNFSVKSLSGQLGEKYKNQIAPVSEGVKDGGPLLGLIHNLYQFLSKTRFSHSNRKQLNKFDWKWILTFLNRFCQINSSNGSEVFICKDPAAFFLGIRWHCPSARRKRAIPPDVSRADGNVAKFAPPDILATRSAATGTFLAAENWFKNNAEHLWNSSSISYRAFWRADQREIAHILY